MSSTGFDIGRKTSPESKNTAYSVRVRVIKQPLVQRTTHPSSDAIVRRPAVPTAAVVWPAPAIFAPSAVRAAEPSATIVTILPSQRFSHLKTFLIAFGAAVCAFGFSLATSEVMAHMNNGSSSSQTVSQPLADADVRTESAALPVTTTPTTLPLSTVVITDPNAIYLPEEKIDAPDPLTQRKAFLTTYLESKHSPLAAHVDALSEQTQWKLIIAISNSESSYCKRNELNNCWGIGGAWDLKAYDNYDQAIADVNTLLEKKYVAAGLTSPDKIEGKWVGYPDQNWELAANEVMSDLKNVQ